MNRSDPSVMLIFDDAGYIAGMQFSYFKKLVNEKYYPFSTAIAYQVRLFYKSKNFLPSLFFRRIVCLP